MPSGTTVEVLCGQPEQKYGVRAATSCVSASARCACFSRATSAAISSFGPMRCSIRSPMLIAISLGSSAPLTGNSQLPLLVLLADADRLVGGAVELLAHLHLDQRALLLDHDDEVEALGEVLEVLPAIGHGQPIL